MLAQRCRERCLEQCNWGEREGGWSPSYPCPPLPLPPAPVHPASVLAGFECVFCNFVCMASKPMLLRPRLCFTSKWFSSPATYWNLLGGFWNQWSPALSLGPKSAQVQWAPFSVEHDGVLGQWFSLNLCNCCGPAARPIKSQSFGAGPKC